MYCSVRGLKVSCIYGQKAYSLVTRRRLKILRVFSLPLNCILLFLQLDVIILDLVQNNDLWKKEKQINNKSTTGLALGAVLKRTRTK